MARAEVLHRSPQRNPTPLELQQADTVWRRTRGLLGYLSLAPAHGLWIRPCNSVHCCFMRFSIDVIYLDRDDRIIRIRHRLRPWGFSLCWGARSVVELAGGECRRLAIEHGDRIQCVA